jgi:hypothetical protein
MRPDKKTKEVLDKKKLDCVVIHGESDDLWVNQNLKPMFASYKSKAIKLQSSNPILSEDQIELMRQSRRIVLVFSRNFLENEWKNKQLHEFLRNIYFNDGNCVIVALVIGDINKEEEKNFMIDIDPTLDNQTKLEKVRRSLEKRIRHNTSLEHVEIIEWHEEDFADNLKFIMPPVKTIIKPSYTKIPTKKEQHIPIRTESPADSYVAERRFSISSNDLPLITSLSKSIEETMRSNKLALGSQRVYPTNDPGLPPQNKRVTKGMIPNQNFWISMPTAQTEVYEPVSTAGPANAGNKEAYLKRFGVSHGYVGYISEQPPPDNPLPQPSFEASTNYRTNKSVRLTRLDLAGIDNGQSDDQSDIYDPNVHNQPIGWTTTDSGRRIIVPESMLTKLGGVESKLASISETNETLSNKKNKKRLEKKLKIQSQSYLVSENSTRPSSADDDYKDTKAIIRSKSVDDKKHTRNKNIIDYQLDEKIDSERKNSNVDNQKTNLVYEKRRNSLSRLQDIEEMTEEKRIQSIIKDNTNGESVKASLSGIKVTKKVTYASSAVDKQIHEIDSLVNELDENVIKEMSEKKKKKKKKKSRINDLENEI